jgi:sterol desaturase/sphingolipid hydroxylase (fatty acid hydroxylase superfamily)
MESTLNTPILAHEAMEHAAKGIQLSFWTFVITVALELWSLDTVKKLLKQNGAGTHLYAAAISTNLRNHFIFGWPIYTFAATLFCHKDEELNIYDRVVSVSTILFGHSLIFYVVHRAFHTHPKLYRHHRFHHRFNVNVTPMAASAVSPVEYIFAYIIPFTVSLPFVKPDTLSIRLSVAIVSLTNILIHTPKLSEVSSGYIPEWLVSTEDHLEHHRKLNTKYAAPTLNIDYFVSFIEGR